MATPHVTGRRGALQGQPADGQRRPRSGKRSSTSATSNWKTSTDPDSTHEKLLDVSKLGPLGTFSLSAPTTGVVPESGGAASIPITINRSSTFFERVRLYVSGIPAGWTASLDRASVFGWSAKSALLNVTAPDSVAAGTYEITVKGLNQGRISAVVATVTVGKDLPTALAPTSAQVKTNVALNAGSAPAVISLARRQ